MDILIVSNKSTYRTYTSRLQLLYLKDLYIENKENLVFHEETPLQTEISVPVPKLFRYRIKPFLSAYN